MNNYINLKTTAEEELYDALQALEKDDLPFVRSCMARAQLAVLDAWKVRPGANTPSTDDSVGT